MGLTHAALVAGTALALLASPLIGVPVALAVAWFAWRRAARGLLAATGTLVAAYGVWLAATTPV